MTYSIRQASITDLSSIQKLTIDGIKTWANDIYENLKPWADVCCSTNELRGKLLSTDYRCFVAENESGVIGCIFLNILSQHMSGLYCSLKGCGVGSALMDTVLREAADTGLDFMTCEIYEHNVASISLMTKLGAIKTSESSFDGTIYEMYTFPDEVVSMYRSTQVEVTDCFNPLLLSV